MMIQVEGFQTLPQFIHKWLETVVGNLFAELAVGATEEHKQDRMPLEEFRTGKAHNFRALRTTRRGFKNCWLHKTQNVFLQKYLSVLDVGHQCSHFVELPQIIESNCRIRNFDCLVIKVSESHCMLLLSYLI
ncbi:hypothetical protein PBCV1_a442R [Paramecium bursaria Chlorella virus 1]|uniref:Uncharacterized protein n=1 Tax=Paramecium bursaria Chlorella virus 1 TaxID=10506 RepID=Q98493_PBCV1|nr:hypothetical protein PBCV1_a442R [Paramecium bursaria Chlorella virus 1]AAC96810.1 hypothetical protein [Paramecium bursaria Chlorella virus 1]